MSIATIMSAALVAMVPGEVAGTQTRTMDVELGDLDGDGIVELVRAVEGDQNQILALSETGWQPSAHFSFTASGSDSEDIALADFNGDGHLDIAIANEDTMRPELYFNDAGEGLLDVSARLDFHARSNAVIAEDLDRDGDMDLVFGDSGPVIFAMNDGAGSFTLTRETHPGDSYAVQDIEAGDVDGDGDLDLIIASEGRNRLLLNSDGAFTASAEAFDAITHEEETREADFADIDQDGDLDLYFANVGFRTQSPAGAPDRILINNGGGVFTDETAERMEAWTAHSLDIDFIDHDADGDLDMLIAGSFGTGSWVLDNDGSGRFANRRALIEPEFNALDLEALPQSDMVYAAGFNVPDRMIASVD